LFSSCTKEDSTVDVIQKIYIDKKSDVDLHQTTYFTLQNFEHNLLSFEQNHLKVQITSYLLANTKKLIITSEMYPSQVFDVYIDQVGQTGELKADIASDYNGWRDILGGFYQIQQGITKRDKLVDEAIADLNLNDFEANSLPLLKAEFGFSKYLPSISPSVLSKCTYTDIRTENFANFYKIQSEVFEYDKELLPYVIDPSRNEREPASPVRLRREKGVFS